MNGRSVCLVANTSRIQLSLLAVIAAMLVASCGDRDGPPGPDPLPITPLEPTAVSTADQPTAEPVDIATAAGSPTTVQSPSPTPVVTPNTTSDLLTPTPTRVPPTPTQTPEVPTPSPTPIPPTPTQTPETPAPAPTVSIEVTAESPTEMTISWSHNLDSPVHQELFRDGEAIAALAQDQSSYVDSDLDPNRRYEYQIVLRREGEPIAEDEAAAATLAHAPGVAGPFGAYATGFVLAIVDYVNPPGTTYKVTVWNAEWYLNAKHHSDWGTSRCRAFEDLPTGLPFEFEVVARNIDGVSTLPVRHTIGGEENLVLPANAGETYSGQEVTLNREEGELQCQALQAMDSRDIETVTALLLSGFSVGRPRSPVGETLGR